MKRILFFAAFSLFAALLDAQTSDFGMWNTISVNKDLGKKFSAGIDQEIRLRDNLTTLNLVYTNFGVSFKLANFFKVGLTYRFVDKHKEDLTWGVRHRLMLDFIFKYKPGKFNLAYRARFQAEWRGAGYDSRLDQVPEIFMRNKVNIGYKATDDIEPYIGCEIRWQIRNPRIPYHNSIDRGRYFAGVNYDINKHNTVGSYFLFQKETNVIDRQTLYIWGLEYTLNLD